MSKTRHPAIFDRRRRRHHPIVALSHDYSPGHRVPPHFHEQHQVVYASEGVMTIETEDGAWVVPSMRGVWIPAKTVHSIEMSGAVLMRTLYLDPSLVKGNPNCFVLNVSPLLRELILHICAQGGLDERAGADRRLIAVLLDQIESIKTIPLQLPLPRDARAKEAARILMKEKTDMTVDALSEAVGASKRTLERLFRSETGVTFGKWKQQMRLLTAIRSLATGLKVVEAALESGYDSPSAFVAMFKGAMGVTPAKFLRDQH